MTRFESMGRCLALALASLAAVTGAGCSGGSEQAGETTTASTTEALSTNYFSGWQQLSTKKFIGTPAIWSHQNGSWDQRMVVGRGKSDFKLYYDYGLGFGGPLNWDGWVASGDPPTGLCTSSPTQEADWTPNGSQTQYGATACAVFGSYTEPRFWVSIKVAAHNGGGSTWHRTAFNMTDTNDVALVYSAPYLHLVTQLAFTGGYTKYYWTRNNVSQGYDNGNWQPMAEIPGGGQFHRPPTAAPLPNGGLLVAGIGTDDRVYMSANYGDSWDNAWYGYGHDRTFSRAVSIASTDGSNFVVAGLSDDGHIWQSTINVWTWEWDGWNQMPLPPSGRVFWSSPTISVAGPNIYDFAALEYDSTVWINRWRVP